MQASCAILSVPKEEEDVVRAERTEKQQKGAAASAGAESLFLAKFGLGSLAGRDEGRPEDDEAYDEEEAFHRALQASLDPSTLRGPPLRDTPLPSVGGAN